ncbi:tetratricopeptide repeat protein [Dysgonomonas sp. 216]|uniref:tetratricopeptide repeat protein n=1 Tax=Dysgonomonas sp. 216 TaxID=2302934 RepID=UPI0013D77BC6|nr:tetratricopeptide repeat protein [Dysgonomonas sp. 216]NDW19368.1 tetratricopeptide repeat protein [Dysgonomonas sp. 216]
MQKYIILIIILLSVNLNTYSQVSSEKLIRRGVSLHDKGRYKDAINYYEQALKVNPTSMSATYEMSLSYLQLEDYNNALKYSTKVINANFQPLLVDAYSVKSSALAELNRIDDAIKLLNEALMRCGDEYILHYNLGLSYFKKKNMSSAILHLRKAIEIDTTHPSSYLLYAYALSDSDRWVQSFLAFHFFLLLEPNTDRSKDAFNEMYDMITVVQPDNSPRLLSEEGIDRRKIYEFIQKNKPQTNDSEEQFKFFENVTKKIILTLNQLQDDSRRGLLWDFFVPTYSEIFASGYIDVYCRYVSVSYFPTSLDWWNNNSESVETFISWFEGGQNTEMDSELEFGDDLDEE